MKTLNLIQGTHEWHAHRATTRNASDAPVMLGVSPYRTRTQLLDERKFGTKAEVSAGQQRRFDDGHAFEAKARAIAEEIVGEDLYPVIGVNGPYSASFDGLTLAEDVAWEHKTLNDELRAVMPPLGVLGGPEFGKALPTHYRAQMEHQLMVCGAKRVLFTASKWDGEKLVEARHCWYESDPELRERIVLGWEQFERDLEAHSAVEVVEDVKGAAIKALPALIVRVEGRVVEANLGIFREAAEKFIASIKTDLQTDQDFVDAENTVKFCADGEERLELVKQQALSQTSTIDELFRTVDHIKEQLRQKRLTLEKLVKARKEQIRIEIAQEAKKALDEHIRLLNLDLAKPWVSGVAADFMGTMKGLKTVASCREKVNTALVDAKLAATRLAKAYKGNWELAEPHATLFPDFAAVGAKSKEDFQALLELRVRQDEEARKAREAAAAPAPAQAHVEATAPAPVPVPQQAALLPASSAPAEDTGARMRLGEISDKLGFAVTQELLTKLGIQPAGTDRRAVLYRLADFGRICSALVNHITNVAKENA